MPQTADRDPAQLAFDFPYLLTDAVPDEALRKIALWVIKTVPVRKIRPCLRRVQFLLAAVPNAEAKAHENFIVVQKYQQAKQEDDRARAQGIDVQKNTMLAAYGPL